MSDEYLWRERDTGQHALHTLDKLRLVYEPEIEDFDSYQYTIVTWDEADDD